MDENGAEICGIAGLWDPARHFNIDPLFAKIPIATKWLNPGDLKRFGRRALEAATWQANNLTWENAHVPASACNALGDAKKIGDLCDDAHAALNELVKYIDPDTIGAPAAAFVFDQLRIKRAQDPHRGSASDDAMTLLAAVAVLRDVTLDAKAKANWLRPQMQNSGDQSKAVFVLTFAQAWTALTGVLPSTQDAGLFVDLLVSAWIDGRQPQKTTDINFERAIKAARAQLRPARARLTTYGPEWFVP